MNDPKKKKPAKGMSFADQANPNAHQANESFLKSTTGKILIGVGILVTIIVISLVVLSMSNSGNTQSAPVEEEEVQVDEVRQQALHEAEARQAQEQQAEQANASALATLPKDDFVFSDDPINRLAEQSVQGIMAEFPQYSLAEGELISPNGSYIPIANLQQAVGEVQNMVAGYITENRMIEVRSKDGIEGWYVRSGEGLQDEDYTIITNATASNNLRDTMRKYTIAQMQTKLSQQQWLARPVQPQQVQQVDPALSPEERQRLLSMIEVQRTNNLELVRENKQLKEEQMETQRKVVDLIQRLEDSPNANARLRATMIPKSSGWSVSAVVGDKIFLNNPNGTITTLQTGDKLPDTNLIISNADANTGIVLVSPAN